MKNNAQRAKMAIYLLWIVLGLEIVMLLSSYLQYDILLLLLDGEDVSDEALDANDTREGLIGLLYTAVFIVSAVMFIRWFRRAYFNLHTKLDGLSCTEGWAAGAWFVPIINLFRPYVIMKELYEQTHNLLVMGEVEEYKTPPNFSVIGIWWGMWVVSSVLGNIVARRTWSAETLDQIMVSTQLSMLSGIIGIPLALLAIKVVKDYAVMENFLFKLEDSIDQGSAGNTIGFGDDEILDAPIG